MKPSLISPINFTIDAFVPTPTQSYLLANTELNVNGYVKSIKVYAAQIGNITLQVSIYILIKTRVK